MDNAQNCDSYALDYCSQPVETRIEQNLGWVAPDFRGRRHTYLKDHVILVVFERNDVLDGITITDFLVAPLF
jgi:hypothetical protein